MSIHIGAPQAVLLALYIASVCSGCVMNGKSVEQHWYSSVIGAAAALAVIAWGGFFS